MEDLVAYKFTGEQPGPHLLILGGIHGNEICGSNALAMLKLELDLGLVTLAAGQLTIVPICNPAAYRARKRFIQQNLNRIIRRWDDPQSPEQHYATQLAKLIGEADMLLDLHSYSAGTIPYVFLDYPTPDNKKFAAALGLQQCLTGWPELYQATPALSEGDTVLQAHRAGKMGVLVECGSHDDPASLAIARTVVMNALRYCDLIEGEPETQDLTTWRVEHVRLRDKDGVFAQDWQNLDKAVQGTPLIDFADGTQFCAPYDGVVILPDAKAAPGVEWIYFGREISL